MPPDASTGHNPHMWGGRGSGMATATEERASARGDDGEGPAWSPRPPLSRRAVARLVQAVGLVDVVLSVLPPGRQHRLSLLADVVPTAGMVPARAATGVVGVLLIYLGAGLRRGQRRAWQLA